eukprot:1934418-Prymnesium_polylepis.1
MAWIFDEVCSFEATVSITSSPSASLQEERLPPTEPRLAPAPAALMLCLLGAASAALVRSLALALLSALESPGQPPGCDMTTAASTLDGKCWAFRPPRP